MTKKWEDLPREDLKNIPKMIKNGFTPAFSYRDIQTKRTTPEIVPLYPVGFLKDDFSIWEIRSGWQTALLSENLSYINHKSFKTLDEALSHINKQTEEQ